MSSFLKLCAGETKKIWAKKSAWIMTVIMTAVILLATLLVAALGDYAKMALNAINFGTGTLGMLEGSELSGTIPDAMYLPLAKKVLPQLEERLEAEKKDLEKKTGAERAMNFMLLSSLERQIQIVRYQIDHGIPRGNPSLCWQFIIFAGSLSISLISLFSLIVGAGSVASEYSDGTIKLLIPRPYKRWKLLLAKLLSTLGYALFLMIVGYLVSLLCGGILFGFAGGGAMVVGSTGAMAYATTNLLNSMLIYFSGLPGLFVTIALAFMLSCLIRSRAVAVGVSMLITLVGGGIIQALSLFGAGWVKYTILVNMDLSTYFTQGIAIEGTGVTFTLVVMAVYLALFLFVSFFTFRKRDI